MWNWITLQFESWIEYRRSLKERKKLCNSCEILKSELEFANRDRDRLLSRLLERPEKEVEKEPVQITKPHRVPWAVKRQELEREDRKLAAELLKNKGKEITTDELEKEVVNASK